MSGTEIVEARVHEDDWIEDGPADGQSGGIGEVWGDHNISITDPSGGVSIIERVQFYVQSSTAEPGTGRSRRLVPEDILTDLTARFVVTPGYGDLVRRLREPATVVISGEPGSGRHAAALMVLKESGTGATRFRELPDDGDVDEPVFDEDAIESGERLLLDLSSVTNPLPGKVLATIRSYRARVAERQAYLAIVLAPELHHVGAELGTEVVHISRPNGREVFLRHLRASGIEVDEHELRDEKLTGHLTQDPMRHVAALAGRVRSARLAAGGAGGLPAWLAAALAPDTQRDAAARFVKDNPDGRVRALLLAAALFEDAAPEAVAFAATALLEVVGYPAHDEHRLNLPDLAEALAGVDASVGDGRVRFRSLGFGDAVRTHFWGMFPDLRIDLRRWLDRCVQPRWLSADARTAAFSRYTDQSLWLGHPEDVCALVELQARRSPLGLDQRLDAAGAALTRGLLSEHGSWFRRRIYHWALDRGLWPSLARLLVGLCVGVIAPGQPQQALVRLRHFTRHQQPAVVAEARAALTELAANGLFARHLLARIHDDLTGDRPTEVDYDLFTDIADPVRLSAGAGRFPHVADPAVATMLAAGWAAVLSDRPYDQVAVAVGRWLDAHAEQPHRDALLAVLAAAARKNTRARAVLYAVSRDWIVSSPPDKRRDRLPTAALLRQMCTRVSTPPTRATQGVTQ
ncbi:hypothetical protein BLA60_03975 [Actinophytocola xinjiangensis]|uniref:Uncharacterized protein n=1 Tax=Actinophytocola xinjiangensis TaxID=485602 RepID=A0A7Z1B0Y3_9PSEU|nr:hypothetical protein [Actinophytocola xinjiangensis]OLF14303.1 hypothetical protein BLA60_03975 [Actinophytocola xinjiangensis]